MRINKQHEKEDELTPNWYLTVDGEDWAMFPDHVMPHSSGLKS